MKLLHERNDELEAEEGSCKFVINFGRKTCSCGWWEIIDLPCKHVAKTIEYKRHNIENYCYEYFTKATYLKVYEGVIHPVPKSNLKPDEEFPPL